MVEYLIAHPLAMVGVFIILIAVPFVWEIAMRFREWPVEAAAPVKEAVKPVQKKRKK